MKSFNFKTILKTLSVFAVVFCNLLVVFPISAADKMDPDCALNLQIEVSPLEVKTWNAAVNVTTKLRRDRPFGYYCSSQEAAQVTVQYNVTGSNSTKTLRTVQLNMPPNQTGVGEVSVVSDGQLFDFSKIGAKANSVGVVVVASAEITRTVGVKTTNVQRISPTVTIKLNANTTVSQTPSGTVTPGSTTTSTTTPPPTGATGLPDDQINSGVTIKPGQSFDTIIGTFFNPLEFTSVPELIVRLINIGLLLAAMIAVVIIIIGGFTLATAMGSEAKITSGKNSIMWAVIGLIVCILSFSIVAIIQKVIS